MATTTSFLNLGDSVSVDIVAFDAPPKASFKVIDTVAEEGKREALYQKVSGNEEYPMTVRAGYYLNKKSNDNIGQTNVSVKLSTFVQKADTDDIIWTLPCSATLALSVPGTNAVPDGEAVIEMLNNLHAWIVPVVTGALSEVALDELKFGVVGALAEHADSAST
jgi:hypothetical protein